MTPTFIGGKKQVGISGGSHLPADGGIHEKKPQQALLLYDGICYTKIV